VDPGFRRGDDRWPRSLLSIRWIAAAELVLGTRASPPASWVKAGILTSVAAGAGREPLSVGGSRNKRSHHPTTPAPAWTAVSRQCPPLLSRGGGSQCQSRHSGESRNPQGLQAPSLSQRSTSQSWSNEEGTGPASMRPEYWTKRNPGNNAGSRPQNS
jgi:hypothetical protein